MREIKTITMYETSDGEQFTNKKEALDYQKMIDAVESGMFFFKEKNLIDEEGSFKVSAKEFIHFFHQNRTEFISALKGKHASEHDENSDSEEGNGEK